MSQQRLQIEMAEEGITYRGTVAVSDDVAVMSLRLEDAKPRDEHSARRIYERVVPDDITGVHVSAVASYRHCGAI